MRDRRPSVGILELGIFILLVVLGLLFYRQVFAFLEGVIARIPKVFSKIR
jgi:hypothetical protein